VDELGPVARGLRRELTLEWRTLERVLGLLATHPEYLGKVRFVQIGAPSRTRIASYQTLAQEIESLVADLNWKYAQGRWMPIIYRHRAHTPEEVLPLYQLADVCGQRAARRHELGRQGICRSAA
jgi:trehalose-6-phosphate synthase